MAEGIEETFDTRGTYLQAIDTVLLAAKKDICIFDADLASLECESRQRADRIAGFLAGGSDRRLRIVLHDLDYLNRRAPRMTALLRRYGHCLTIRQSSESMRNLSDAFLLADGESGVIRFHADHFRGKLLIGHPMAVHDWYRRFEDLWMESVPGASATHLGL
jgi:hypothetical protein